MWIAYHSCRRAAEDGVGLVSEDDPPRILRMGPRPSRPRVLRRGRRPAPNKARSPASARYRVSLICNAPAAGGRRPSRSFTNPASGLHREGRPVPSAVGGSRRRAAGGATEIGNRGAEEADDPRYNLPRGGGGGGAR